MKILITGASGYVGAKLYKDLKDAEYDVVGTYHNNKLFEELVEADLTNELAVQKLISETKPSVVIHSVATSSSKACEKDPEMAQRLNVNATRNLVEASRKASIRFIHISTFACFDEFPSNVYSRTKKEAEELVKTLKNYVILRLSLVVGLSPYTAEGNYKFYNDMVSAFRKGKKFAADVDWQFEFSYLGNISKVVKTIVDTTEMNKVIVPYAEAGVTTKYKFAKDLFEGADMELTEEESGRNRPVSSFDQSILQKYGMERDTYENAVNQMRKELKIK